MQINGTQYPIIVQLPPDQRRSLQAVENLNVPTATTPGATSTGNVSSGVATGGNAGGSLQNSSSTTSRTYLTLPAMPLRRLANITFGTGPSEITRQNKQREIDINAGLRRFRSAKPSQYSNAVMNRSRCRPATTGSSAKP